MTAVLYTPRGRQPPISPREDFESITVGVSQPADSAEPSLLTLPAEIRNAVYELLFHVPGGIRITPSESYSLGQSFESGDVLQHIVEGLPLLSTCRQIYHEAATTLFSGNTWTAVRRVSGKYSYVSGVISQVPGAARILRTFGTRGDMVKKVCIDLDKTCPYDCPAHLLSRCFDVYTDVEHGLPMLELLQGLRHHPELDVHFVHPMSQAHHDFHSAYGLNECKTGCDPELLSTILCTLRHDPLGLWKYGRLVKEVWIQRNGVKGCVDWGFEGKHMQRFSISASGGSLQWAEETAELLPLALLKLPWHILSKILDELLCVGENTIIGKATWDLDARRMTGPSLAPLQLCGPLRSVYYYGFWAYTPHCIRLGSSAACTDFGGFLTLGAFFGIGPFHERRGKEIEWNSEVEILLNFDLEKDARLEDIRINIAPFLDVTARCRNEAQVSVCITGAQPTPRLQMTISMGQCKALGLKALQGTHLHTSNYEPWGECAPIWINGRFELVSKKATGK